MDGGWSENFREERGRRLDLAVRVEETIEKSEVPNELAAAGEVVRQALEREKIFGEGKTGEKYRRMVEKIGQMEFTAEETAAYLKINGLLRAHSELVRGLAAGLVNYQEHRLREEVKYPPSMVDAEFAHIDGVTQMHLEGFERGGVEGLTVLAAAVHDVAKRFAGKEEGKSLFNLGLHDLMGAEVGSRMVGVALREALKDKGLTEAEFLAAEKFVKMAIAVHGKGEFPVLMGKQEALKGRYFDEEEKVMGVFGTPVFEVDCTAARNSDNEEVWRMVGQADILSDLDKASGCGLEAFYKYHTSDSLARFRQFTDSRHYLVGSFGGSFAANIENMSETGLKQVKEVYQEEIVSAGLVLGVVNSIEFNGAEATTASLKEKFGSKLDEKALELLVENCKQMLQIDFLAEGEGEKSPQIRHEKLFGQVVDEVVKLTEVFRRDEGTMKKVAEWAAGRFAADHKIRKGMVRLGLVDENLEEPELSLGEKQRLTLDHEVIKLWEEKKAVKMGILDGVKRHLPPVVAELEKEGLVEAAERLGRMAINANAAQEIKVVTLDGKVIMEPPVGILDRNGFVEDVLAHDPNLENTSLYLLDLADFSQNNKLPVKPGLFKGGDIVINRAADRLVRRTETVNQVLEQMKLPMRVAVCRYGGDEFFLAIQGVEDEQTRRLVYRMIVEYRVDGLLGVEGINGKLKLKYDYEQGKVTVPIDASDRKLFFDAFKRGLVMNSEDIENAKLAGVYVEETDRTDPMEGYGYAQMAVLHPELKTEMDELEKKDDKGSFLPEVRKHLDSFLYDRLLGEKVRSLVDLRSHMTQNRYEWMMVVDPDNIKELNDLVSMLAGDAAIKALYEEMKKKLGKDLNGCDFFKDGSKLIVAKRKGEPAGWRPEGVSGEVKFKLGEGESSARYAVLSFDQIQYDANDPDSVVKAGLDYASLVKEVINPDRNRKIIGLLVADSDWEKKKIDGHAELGQLLKPEVWAANWVLGRRSMDRARGLVETIGEILENGNEAVKYGGMDKLRGLRERLENLSLASGQEAG